MECFSSEGTSEQGHTDWKTEHVSQGEISQHWTKMHKFTSSSSKVLPGSNWWNQCSPMLEFNTGILVFLMNCSRVLSVLVYLTKIFNQAFLALLSSNCNVSLAPTLWTSFSQANYWHWVPQHPSTSQPHPNYNAESCHLGWQCIAKKKKKKSSGKKSCSKHKINCNYPRVPP